MNLYQSTGKELKLPLFDPLVAAHVNNPSSLIGTLLHQINQDKIYAPLFESKQGLTFLDIGANIGLVSLYAAPSCSRIVAVEPAKDTFDVLKAMTVGEPKIEAIQAALAPTDGPVVFYTNDINTTASSTVNTYGTQGSVNGLTFTSLLNIYQLEKVDVAKIDCEGGEGESLNFQELERAKDIVQCYLIETHNCPKSTWEHKLGVLVQMLSVLGYHDQRIDGMALTARKK